MRKQPDPSVLKVLATCAGVYRTSAHAGERESARRRIVEICGRNRLDPASYGVQPEVPAWRQWQLDQADHMEGIAAIFDGLVVSRPDCAAFHRQSALWCRGQAAGYRRELR
jgi:hypothetical protein